MRPKALILIVLGLTTWGGLALSAQVAPAAPAAPAADAAPAPATPTKSQWDGLFTLAQAKRGYTLYDKQCAFCHMPELTGGGPQDSVKLAPPLVGTEFTSYWNTRTLEQLANVIQTTMPPEDKGTLSRKQTVDILAFMLDEGNYPAGKVELPADGEGLKSMIFLEKRPARPRPAAAPRRPAAAPAAPAAPRRPATK